MEMHKDTPVYLFKDTVAFENWLKKFSESVPAIWIKFAKKNSGESSMAYNEAVELSLCYGWIDGLLNTYDEKHYLIRFTPRGPKSVWSKRNRELIEQLIKGGRMQSSGLAKVEAAKIDGRWEAAYDSQKNMQFPKAFLEELKKDKKAEEFFTTLTKANKYAIAWRLQTAVRQETKEKRMKTILTMLHNGEKIH